MTCQRLLTSLLTVLLLSALTAGQLGSAPRTMSARTELASRAALTGEERLYLFLAARQDGVTGLLSSYEPHAGLPRPFLSFVQDQRPAFTYDNALAALAWMARGRPADRLRARAVLDGLLAAQAADGSLPEALAADTGASVLATSTTGNQAWTMLAWITGHELLGETSWLLAAERAGAYLLESSHGLVNPVGFGGFRFASGQGFVSTEHNLDAYVAFQRLAPHLPTAAGLLELPTCLDAAARARLFAESRFDAVSGLTFTGTDAGGVLTNDTVIPLDTQTWPVLALGRDKWRRGYEAMLQPAPAGLWTTASACPRLGPFVDGLPIQGPAYSSADTGNVWFEGLAQARVVARLLDDLTTDVLAGRVLELVQRGAPNADGLGLVATCAEVDTGFGFAFFNALAVAPTAWAALASRRLDPFWLRDLDDGLSGHPGAGLPSVSLDVPGASVYACSGSLPCFFTVRGTSAGVFGTTRQIHVLVEPTLPSAGGQWFTQAVPATVAGDGSWSASAQLGDGTTPVQSGDQMRLVALVVDGAAPPTVLTVVTLDTVPELVTVSGLLDASVQ